jgi:hypothetical protein
VYVERKLDKPAAPVPDLHYDFDNRPHWLKPNVVATGKRPTTTMAATAVYTGLHPGAAISTQGTVGGTGAIACLLRRGAAPSHALTAGHLFRPGSNGAPVFAAKSGTSPVQVGSLIANFLDTDDVDAAVIALDAAGVAMVTAGGPALSDFLAETSIFGKQAIAFLATTNDFSRETTTSPGPMDALLEAPTRGNFWVRGGVGSDGEVTNAGDSGTILSSGASSQFAVGTCSGVLGTHSVFEPFARVIDLVQRNIDSNLSL